MRPSLALTALLLLAGAASAAPGGGDVAAERERLEKNAKDPFEQRSRTAALRALGRIGGEAAAEVVCSVLEDPFVHVRDHAVSALIDALKGDKADETRAYLVRGPLADRAHPAVRRGVATALGVRGGPEAWAALAAAAAKEGDPVVLEAMARALERAGDPALATTLLPALAAKDGAAAGAVARTIGRLSSDAAVVERLSKLLATRKEPLARAGAVDGLAAAAPAVLAAAGDAVRADPAFEPRIALADALPALAAAGEKVRATALLGALLADASWRVRVAAAEAAVALWDKEAVPLLIERLAAETGRLRRDVLRALEQLTGAAVGRDADLWRAWWKTHGAELSLGERPRPDAHGRVRRPAKDASAAAPDETKTAAFYRLPVESARLAFLFDFSGSMRDPGEGGGGSKADDARREFGKVAASLPKDTLYDLFIYRYPSAFPPAPKLTRALGTLSPGGAAASRKATEWLAREEPKGWGAFYDGLVLAAAEEVDTIVLLSDGVPSMGTYDRGFRLVDELVRANRFRRVAVDTVLVGSKGTDREFMADLADATGGRFQDAGKGR
ncbi:MAG: hypothetical protein IT460_05000 [Planctomycetes bacterium]|nr:hypothetical protein [Planctomycetota bacterium]